jgi:Holliday junction resolvase RusA-like endonuclease
MTEPLATFTLPVPPSTNNLYRSGPRYKTNEYKRWITEAAYGLMVQGMSGALSEIARGRYLVEIEVPFSGRRDIDNVKPVLDIAVKCGVFTNDNLVDELRVKRVPVGSELTVKIYMLESASSKTPRKRVA